MCSSKNQILAVKGLNYDMVTRNIELQNQKQKTKKKNKHLKKWKRKFCAISNTIFGKHLSNYNF